MSSKEYGQSVRRTARKKQDRVDGDYRSASIASDFNNGDQGPQRSNFPGSAGAIQSMPGLQPSSSKSPARPQPQQRNVSLPVQLPSKTPMKGSSASASANRPTFSSSVLSAPSVPQEGLREIVKRRLLEDVFQSCMEKWKGWTVCVVDEPGMRVMSNVMGMYDLMEQRVTLVESIAKKRAPFREMAVVYVISPTQENISQIIQDYSGQGANPQPLYGPAVFIYTLNKLPQQLLEQIKMCRPLVKSIRALREINMDFVAKENRAFHFDMQTSIKDLFSSRSSSPFLLATIVEKLVTVCATLNEYPHVRYPANSSLCQELAEAFHRQMNEFVAAAPSWWYYGMQGHMERDRSTLLLLDRSLDVLSPLMHEFTYQAMVNDLLNIDDDKISYKAEAVVVSKQQQQPETVIEPVKKDVLLNDNDELWVEFRCRHIADVIQTLSSRIREIMDSHTGAKLATDSGRSLTLSEMASALKQLPEYQEVMSKLSQHMHVSHQCMSVFTREKLLDLAELEQTLATGITEEGRTPKTADLLNDVEDKIRGMPPCNKAIAALRLLSIFVITQKGATAAALNRMLAVAQAGPTDEKTLSNFSKLGRLSLNEPVPLTAPDSMMKSILGVRNKPKAVAMAKQDSEYSSSRYVCKLKGILEAMAENNLSIDDYPSVLPLPFGTTGSAASVRTKATRHKSRFGGSDQMKKSKSFVGPRQIVFMAGGMCYSELRSAEELMSLGEREFILGSTYFLKPADYIKEVGTL